MNSKVQGKCIVSKNDHYKTIAAAKYSHNKAMMSQVNIIKGCHKTDSTHFLTPPFANN